MKKKNYVSPTVEICGVSPAVMLISASLYTNTGMTAPPAPGEADAARANEFFMPSEEFDGECEEIW